VVLLSRVGVTGASCLGSREETGLVSSDLEQLAAEFSPILHGAHACNYTVSLVLCQVVTSNYKFDIGSCLLRRLSRSVEQLLQAVNGFSELGRTPEPGGDLNGGSELVERRDH
jgi:hypothetical protein